MPSGNMYRTEVLVTGVAGSPYYIRGYFSAAGGTADQAAQAWWRFVGGAASDHPAGSIWTLTPIVDVVDAVTGQTIGTSPVSNAGHTGSGSASAPHALQIMLGWGTGIFLNGREIRGRTNIPLPALADVGTAGQVLGATVTRYTGRAAALIAEPLAEFVVYSKTERAWHSVIAAYVKSEFAVLRSRRD